MDLRRSILVLVALLLASAASAQQPNPARKSPDSRIHLDVVVTQKSGSPVSGLRQQDFTILDNKSPQPITSFQEVDGTHAAIEVIIVLDAMNAPFGTAVYERDQIDKFLRADQGDLTYPTGIEVLTDTGLQPVSDFSKDGNKLSAALDKYAIKLRFFNRTYGIDGGFERFQVSLNSLSGLVQRESSRPGRKIFLWVSPGWPLLSGPVVLFDKKLEELIFQDIISLSTELRRGRITLYCVDPEGTVDDIGGDTYWENFVKGVRKPSKARFGNLTLEVLSTQSGGMVLSLNNDIRALLQRCLADTRAYYELSFDTPAGARPNQYHRLKIHIAKRGLRARTWQGYYSGVESESRPALPAPVVLGTR